jgi:hypothetical protein
MVRSTLALAAVLSVASISLAGDLVTPSIFVGLSTAATCKMVNISSSTITAQMQIVGGDGNVIVDSQPLMVSAGAVRSIGVNLPGDNVYCRFVKASKSKVRGSLTAFVSSGDSTDQIVVAAQ